MKNEGIEELSYNTSRTRMIIPEYGRNVQKMVNYALSVEDRDERNKVAKAIINVMGQLNPHLRDVEDFTHKLWAHLFIMSDFKLDVDSPYPIPTAETFSQKPERVDYPQSYIKYGHYGKTIPKMIQKCIELTDEKEKEVLTNIIGNMMKKSYLMWNRDTVNDELIANQLKELSNGKLELKDLSVLTPTSEIVKNKPTNTSNNNNRRRGRSKKGKKRY